MRINRLGSSSPEKSLWIILDYKLNMRPCHAVAEMPNNSEMNVNE